MAPYAFGPDQEGLPILEQKRHCLTTDEVYSELVLISSPFSKKVKRLTNV